MIHTSVSDSVTFVAPPLDDAVALLPRTEGVVEFPEGVPGFERCRRFVVVASDELKPLQLLQGLEGSSPAFLTIDPTLALPNYRMLLGPADCHRLHARPEDPLLWLAMVTIVDDETATVNLRAPVVINPRLMVGFQVMPHDSLYPIRQPLSL